MVTPAHVELCSYVLFHTYSLFHLVFQSLVFNYPHLFPIAPHLFPIAPSPLSVISNGLHLFLVMPSLCVYICACP